MAKKVARRRRLTVTRRCHPREAIADAAKPMECNAATVAGDQLVASRLFCKAFRGAQVYDRVAVAFPADYRRGLRIGERLVGAPVVPAADVLPRGAVVATRPLVLLEAPAACGDVQLARCFDAQHRIRNRAV